MERPQGHAEEDNARENANDAHVPLLRGMEDQEAAQHVRFMCFQRVNRDVLGLIGIALMLVAVVGFLYLISW